MYYTQIVFFVFEWILRTLNVSIRSYYSNRDSALSIRSIPSVQYKYCVEFFPRSNYNIILLRSSITIRIYNELKRFVSVNRNQFALWLVNHISFSFSITILKIQ